jgi:peptide-methionine (S)-S-oxide reductase
MQKLAGWIYAGALVATTACASPAQKPAAAPAMKPASAAPAAAQTAARLEKATFAGGCFWCEETAFEGLPGVKSVISGYTGGTQVDPTYEEVSAGRTGHAESVQITYDPKAVTYAQLLDIFWHNVDPTQANGQFCDHGNQYRSAVYYHDATQKRLAEESKRALESGPRKFKGAFVTEITAASRFWPAEEYHQDYYRKNPDGYQSYRTGCGRDRRLTQLWGKPGRQGHAVP